MTDSNVPVEITDMQTAPLLVPLPPLEAHPVAPKARSESDDLMLPVTGVALLLGLALGLCIGFVAQTQHGPVMVQASCNPSIQVCAAP